jgi:hypothetical protein
MAGLPAGSWPIRYVPGVKSGSPLGNGHLLGRHKKAGERHSRLSARALKISIKVKRVRICLIFIVSFEEEPDFPSHRLDGRFKLNPAIIPLKPGPLWEGSYL